MRTVADRERSRNAIVPTQPRMSAVIDELSMWPPTSGSHQQESQDRERRGSEAQRGEELKPAPCIDELEIPRAGQEDLRAAQFYARRRQGVVVVGGAGIEGGYLVVRVIVAVVIYRRHFIMRVTGRQGAHARSLVVGPREEIIHLIRCQRVDREGGIVRLPRLDGSNAHRSGKHPEFGAAFSTTSRQRDRPVVIDNFAKMSALGALEQH